MEGFQACPSCYNEIDIIVVPKQDPAHSHQYYFVNCKECGEGTKEAFPSVEELKTTWNNFVSESKIF